MIGLPRFMIHAKYNHQKNGRTFNYSQFEDQLMENVNGRMKKKIAKQCNRTPNWMLNCMSDIVFASIGSVQKNMVSFHMSEKQIKSNNKPLMQKPEFILDDICFESKIMIEDGRLNIIGPSIDEVLYNSRIDEIKNANVNELEDALSNMSFDLNPKFSSKRPYIDMTNANKSKAVRTTKKRKRKKKQRYEVDV